MSYFKAIMHQVRFLAEGDRAEGAYKRGKGREGLAPNLKKHQSPLPPPVSTAPVSTATTSLHCTSLHCHHQSPLRFVIGVSVVTGLTGQTAGASRVWNDAVDAAAASAGHIDSTATCSSVPRDHRCAARHTT